MRRAGSGPAGAIPQTLVRGGGVLFSLYAWASWGAHLAVYVPLILLALRFRPAQALPLTRLMARSLLTSLGVRVSVAGAEQLDPQAAYMYICNHQSRLDPYLLALAVPQKVIGIEHDTNFRYPLYGLLVSHWGNIPISHEDHAQAIAALHLAAELYRQGRSLVIFPEGKLTPDGALGPFKPGGFHLAVEAQACLVPVILRGAYEVLPQGTWLIRPGEVEVRFGAPRAVEGRSPEALEAELRAEIAQGLVPS